ncbi:hypothetical protein HII36_11350 [Nonomuraea sp. NN258]|uniref:hypothetical protein n=1 Tax=Nonomuraea antri TaxID=2730852 RepID=UPI0015696181|nr:hypothetical protein [Nonomuraea antri]NRQ32430.1 hypothetical protein [Nonomuraea antri]
MTPRRGPRSRLPGGGWPAKNIRRIAARLPEARAKAPLRGIRWNVQWWAALTTVVAGLMSVPALVISLSALNATEQQRLEAQRHKADSEAALQRAYAQRMAIEAGQGSLVGALLDGGTITISNGNTIGADVEILLGVAPDTSAEDTWRYAKVLFASPACTRATYEIPARLFEKLEALDDGGRLDEAVFIHPLDRRRWLFPDLGVGIAAQPLPPDRLPGFSSRSGAMMAMPPPRMRAVAGCA